MPSVVNGFALPLRDSSQKFRRDHRIDLLTEATQLLVSHAPAEKPQGADSQEYALRHLSAL
jgi:hypothetical protein